MRSQKLRNQGDVTTYTTQDTFHVFQPLCTSQVTIQPFFDQKLGLAYNAGALGLVFQG